MHKNVEESTLTREGAWGVPIPWAGKQEDAEHGAVRPGDYRGVHHGGHHGQEGLENLVKGTLGDKDDFVPLCLYSCWVHRGGGRGDVSWEA